MKCYYCQQELTTEYHTIGSSPIYVCKNHLDARVRHNFVGKAREELSSISITKQIGDVRYQVLTAFQTTRDRSQWTMICELVEEDNYKNILRIAQITNITPENFEDKVKLYILFS
jgi:hypothetical protein